MLMKATSGHGSAKSDAEMGRSPDDIARGVRRDRREITMLWPANKSGRLLVQNEEGQVRSSL